MIMYTGTGNKSVLEYPVCILLVLMFYIEEDRNDSFDYIGGAIVEYGSAWHVCPHHIRTRSYRVVGPILPICSAHIARNNIRTPSRDSVTSPKITQNGPIFRRRPPKCTYLR